MASRPLDDLQPDERVKENLQEGGRVRLGLGTDSAAQIPSNQKAYGPWGL